MGTDDVFIITATLRFGTSPLFVGLLHSKRANIYVCCDNLDQSGIPKIGYLIRKLPKY